MILTSEIHLFKIIFAFGPWIAINERLSSSFKSYLSFNFSLIILKSPYLQAAFKIIQKPLFVFVTIKSSIIQPLSFSKK